MREILLTLLLMAGLASCSTDTDKMVEIRTPYGTMKAVLFDDTPRHRDNFLRLARAHKYDSLLFHRVLRGYLIQGGDPQSRHAEPGQRLGRNSIGKGIEAEIRYPEHFHKRGALCAARSQDEVNPTKESSGSQFYIVQGMPQETSKLDEFATIHDNKLRGQIYQDLQVFYQDSLQQLQDEGKAQELADMHIRIIEKTEMVLQDKGHFTYPDEVREAYQTIGGTPELDGDYTVFGEVVEGLEIIDSIAQQPVEVPGLRPAKDIWMVIRVIE